MSDIPTLCDDEILPSGWHDYAEQKGIPDEQIYRSWKRFKDVTAWPFQYRRWQKWIDGERVIRNAGRVS
jgi:hypothetical protein